MEIKIGHLYENRTQKYLLPILLSYGESFQVKLNSIFNLAFGIHDTFLDRSVHEDQRYIYILCDRKCMPAKFWNFLNYVKHQEYYIMDYAFDDIEAGRKHMIVLNFPEQFHNAYDMFLLGNYAQMYTDEEIKLYIKPTNPIIQVLKRTNLMQAVFIKNLKDTYGTEVTFEEAKEMEYDFPYKKEEEIFNYKYREEGS